ncbi:hypothetical protein MVEN_01716700 [Mycena venus]|uniref:Uncharacterized protein n=1 Tax=Mycena venus TaxID=2733690 RepID=A0A8H6XPT4_9AGAR|nr:hypothetical protein MVEN_01716700 [Mycena venus]
MVACMWFLICLPSFLLPVRVLIISMYSGRIVDLATRSSECHVLQEALDCEEKTSMSRMYGVSLVHESEKHRQLALGACASRRRDIFARRVIIVDPALSLTGSQLITSLLLRLTRTGAPPLQLHPRTHPHASPLQHRLKCFLALVCSSLSTLSHGELADRLRPHYGPARCTLRLRPWTHHHAAASRDSRLRRVLNPHPLISLRLPDRLKLCTPDIIRRFPLHRS